MVDLHLWRISSLIKQLKNYVNHSTNKKKILLILLFVVQFRQCVVLL